MLAWLNHHYEHHRQKVWESCTKGGVPPSRWIVNYDFDLLDGLVLGAVLGAHMPFLVRNEYYKYLSWVHGVDRKICHEGH